MKLPHKIILPAAAIALVAAGAVSAVALQTHAQTTTQSSGNPMSNLVNAIAQKFGLKPGDVQQVFDDQRTQIEAQHQQQFADRINQDVSDGKLTQDQADKILDKIKELDAQRQADQTNFANMTEQQRRDAVQKQKSDLKQWAQDNNIPLQYLMFGHMDKHEMSPGMMGGHHGPF